MLVAVGEVGPGDAGGRALAGQAVLDRDLALARAEAAGHPVELGVPVDPGTVRGEMPGPARDVLDGDVLELRAALEEDLGDGVRVGLELLVGRRRLLDQREAG